MNFEDLNWDILDRLRATFLEGKPARRAYWTCDEDLAQYDATFGERIGWKWDAVLADLKELGWTPPAPADRVLDWGCGSGVAGRRVLQAFPWLRVLELHDRSAVAVEFSARRAREALPGVTVHGTGAPATAHGALLVLSHVCNELDPRAEARLLSTVATASAVLWIEPGTHAVARRLQGFRERLKDSFDIVAPCTHAASCPLLAKGHERDWCHHFAEPPPWVFTNGHWARFARRAAIDLRSLPYACLVMQERSPVIPSWTARRPERALGRPRFQKGFVEVMTCSSCGVATRQGPRRPREHAVSESGSAPAGTQETAS